MISVMISGLAYETFMNFLFLLMAETMEVSNFVKTLAMTTGGAASIIVFPFSTKIIKFFRGPIPCIALGIFSYFIRYMIMSYTTNPYLMVGIQALQGFGYALSWASILEHTCIISPKEITMTMVTIDGSTHNVASTSIANMFGGFLFQIYGGRVLFRGGAIICGSWSLFMCVYFGIKHLRMRKEERREYKSRCTSMVEAAPVCTPALYRQHRVQSISALDIKRPGNKNNNNEGGKVFYDVELGNTNMVCDDSMSSLPSIKDEMDDEQTRERPGAELPTVIEVDVEVGRVNAACSNDDESTVPANILPSESKEQLQCEEKSLDKEDDAPLKSECDESKNTPSDDDSCKCDGDQLDRTESIGAPPNDESSSLNSDTSDSNDSGIALNTKESDITPDLPKVGVEIADPVFTRTEPGQPIST